jgi:glycosyltransferase involved in cell wall biosynthesis
MPVRNGETFIEETLQSLPDQTFDDFELIISDNASEDRTSIICQHYAGRDRRIRYSRFQTNVGAAPNYNQVFRLAGGRFFKWVSHDDICLPDYLIRCVEVFQSSPPNVVVVYSRTELINEKNRSLGRDRLSLSI